jgi:hypothetical protein
MAKILGDVSGNLIRCRVGAVYCWSEPWCVFRMIFALVPKGFDEILFNAVGMESGQLERWLVRAVAWFPPSYFLPSRAKRTCWKLSDSSGKDLMCRGLKLICTVSSWTVSGGMLLDSVP